MIHIVILKKFGSIVAVLTAKINFENKLSLMLKYRIVNIMDSDNRFSCKIKVITSKISDIRNIIDPNMIKTRKFISFKKIKKEEKARIRKEII